MGSSTYLQKKDILFFIIFILPVFSKLALVGRQYGSTNKCLKLMDKRSNFKNNYNFTIYTTFVSLNVITLGPRLTNNIKGMIPKAD